MIDTPCAVALGFFDGVHIAHQKIIKCAVDYAKTNNLTPVVLSFEASPLEILAPGKAKYLTTHTQKERIITSLGAKAVFLPISAEFLNMSPPNFIREILVDKFSAKYAVCGYNYRFGKGGAGDTRLLSLEGEKLGFETKILECENFEGESVSSSRIRELITEGNVMLAEKLLGRPFFVEGTVSEGKHLGRTIGFPTANMFLENGVIIPKNGVYKTRVTVDAKTYSAITNTGINPTVGGEALRTETYIPNSTQNIYNKEMKIEFIEFIRSERKFESINALKRQIAEDVLRL